MKVKSLSHVQLCNPMDCSLPRSSVHGIFQARVLEWVAISFSRGSAWPRDRTQISHIAGRRFTIWATPGQINGIAIHIVRNRLYQAVSQYFRAGTVNIGSDGVGSYQHAMMGGEPKIFLPKEASSPILSEKSSWSHLYSHRLQVDRRPSSIPAALCTVWVLRSLSSGDVESLRRGSLGDLAECSLS